MDCVDGVLDTNSSAHVALEKSFSSSSVLAPRRICSFREEKNAAGLAYEKVLSVNALKCDIIISMKNLTSQKGGVVMWVIIVVVAAAIIYWIAR